jgi:hypothetical protein
MIPLRIASSCIISVLLLPCFALNAQTPATPASIEQKLEAQYTVTKTTADKSDIVTAGSVLVLKKDGLLMSATTSGNAAQNTYKDGKISQGIWKMAKMPGFGSLMSHSGTNANVQTRTFVSGEKFWVTKITVHEDGVVLDLFSDPFSDVRYYSMLRPQATAERNNPHRTPLLQQLRRPLPPPWLRLHRLPRQPTRRPRPPKPSLSNRRRMRSSQTSAHPQRSSAWAPKRSITTLT